MIGLSVAIGRFVEALFWAILRVAGTVATAVVGGAVVLAALVLLARHLLRSSPARGGGPRRDGVVEGPRPSRDVDTGDD